MIQIDRPEAVYWLPQGSTQRSIDRFTQEGSEPWLRNRMCELLEQRPGCVISAGCYVGGLLPWLSKYAQQVWSWDAVSEHVACAQRMLGHNAIGNCTIRHAALGDCKGTATITTGCSDAEWLGGASCLVIDGKLTSPVLSDLTKWKLRTQQVPQHTLDSYKFSYLSILQLDLEGTEHLALAGAAQTVERWNPIIIIENNPQAHTLLTDWGYTAQETHGSDTVYIRNK